MLYQLSYVGARVIVAAGVARSRASCRFPRARSELARCPAGAAGGCPSRETLDARSAAAASLAGVTVAGDAPKVWLGHGASGGPETMQPYIERLRAHGIDASALRLPKGAAERAMQPLREQLGAQLADSVIGGHSFGGRVASLVAGETPPAGLVLISYPLHRPGHAEQLRTAHWPRIACPVLLLSGDRDQFARIELLRESVKLLDRAELHVFAGFGHGLTRAAEEVAQRIADFARALPTRPDRGAARSR